MSDVVEQYTIRPIPDSQRRGTSRGLFPFWFTANSSAFTVVLGAIGIELGLGIVPTIHSRTAYQDHPEPERRRDLIRLWLDALEPQRRHAVPDARSAARRRPVKSHALLRRARVPRGPTERKAR
jgi:hypothetical protein